LNNPYNIKNNWVNTDITIWGCQNEFNGSVLLSVFSGLLNYSIIIVKIVYGKYYTTFCISDNLTPNIVNTDISIAKLLQNITVIL